MRKKNRFMCCHTCRERTEYTDIQTNRQTEAEDDMVVVVMVVVVVVALLLLLLLLMMIMVTVRCISATGLFWQFYITFIALCLK